MKIDAETKKRESALALVAVMILAAVLSIITIAASRRSAVLKQELDLLDARQKSRWESIKVSGNTNFTPNGQNTRN